MKLRHIMTYFNNMLKYIKRGGVTYVTISPITKDNALKDKKALITGGSSGFGLAMAKKFLSEGATVLITGRNKEKLENTVSEIDNERLLSLVWDISDVKIAKKR